MPYPILFLPNANIGDRIEVVLVDPARIMVEKKLLSDLIEQNDKVYRYNIRVRFNGGGDFEYALYRIDKREWLSYLDVNGGDETIPDQIKQRIEELEKTGSFKETPIKKFYRIIYDLFEGRTAVRENQKLPIEIDRSITKEEAEPFIIKSLKDKNIYDAHLSILILNCDEISESQYLIERR
jgi:hypothetical protein